MTGRTDPRTAPAAAGFADRAQRRRRRSPISLTPLIDVVFILLIFFMLASSFLDWRAIDLDAPVRAAAGPGDGTALVIEVGPDTLALAGESVGWATLEARLGAVLADRPGRSVLIVPAPAVPLQRTIAVLDRARAAGAGDIRLGRPARAAR